MCQIKSKNMNPGDFNKGKNGDTVKFNQIIEAKQRLSGIAKITPVMTSNTLDDMAGAAIFLKCENYQKIGAFKIRGAYNAISKLPEDEKQRGILTFSSGNHAQAVAWVGSHLNISTTIVMPNNAPQIKRKATEGYGASIIDYDPDETSREKLAQSLQEEHDLIMIPPYDHQDIIAGQGTAALELMEQIDGIKTLLVPCGGGGLLSGSAIASKGINPKCEVIGIEPELADDATRSFRTGSLHSVKNPQTIADGTRTPSLGQLTFPLVLEYVDDMRTVPESAIKEAVRFLFYRMKMVVEPSGALGIAALLSGVVKSNGNVGVIISGGNIDGSTMSAILSEA